MKKILNIMLIVLLCSCQKETPVIENSNELETIKIEHLKKFLPLTESNSKTKAVFYNAEEKEIIFDFSLEEKMEKKIIESKSYFTEEISGHYTNESINDYSLYFVGFGNYLKSDEPPTIGILASIRQTVEPASSILTLDDSGTPILATLYGSKQLLDREFEAVYSNFIFTELTAFSELYYNATYGIIGFKDRKGDLYVLKEFID